MSNGKFVWIILLSILYINCWKIHPLQAKTMYVTDTFNIAVRSGKSTRHKALRWIPSGTSVEVLSDHSQSGYSRVRVSGETGWVLTRQLIDRPVARDQLRQLRERLHVLQSSPENARTQLISLQEEHQNLQRICKQTNSDKQKLEQDLVTIRRTAANAISIDQERIKLRKKVHNLARKREIIEQELKDLRNQVSYRWFLSGAGVLLFGLLAGAILPQIRWRRKDTWGSF